MMQKLDRKSIKSAARGTIRRHYMKLLFVCLLAAILGIEYGNTLELFGAYRVAEDGPRSLNELESIYSERSPGNGLGGIWSDILSGKITEGMEDVKTRLQAIRNEDVYVGRVELGHSRGVFASFVNMITSGELLTLILATLDTVTGSETIAVAVMAIVGLAIEIFIRVFFMNAYRVTMKRLFLEARIYEELPASRFLFLMRIQKWFAASLSMLLYGILALLSLVLIIPYPFVRYSYFLTPYLVAENPALSPIEAMRLSRQMMRGHKFEAFKLELTMFPWTLLSLITGGLAGLFFANAYNEAVLSEYYVFIRSTCLESSDIAKYLIDPYLFEHADTETLRRAYAETAVLMDQPLTVPERSGIWGFLSRNFGVIHSYDDQEKQHRKCTRIQLQIDEYKDVLEGKTYPSRLSRFHEHHRKRIATNTDYMRHYSIPSLVLMFFIFSAFGWSWEVTLHLIEFGTFVNRGVLHGPWLPIYGTGGLLILLGLYRLRDRPHLEFLAAIVLSGIVEYGTSLVLELIYGQKWWDYSGYFINLNGRICAEGLLVFGIGGIVVVYLVAPVLDDYLARIRSSIIWPLSVVLLLIFSLDNFYSRSHPNTGEGVTDISAGGSAAEGA